MTRIWKGKSMEIDSNAFIQAVRSGLTQKEIMTQFGLRTQKQLKVAYADALMATGIVPEIPTKRPRDRSAEVRIKNGALDIPKEILAKLGLPENAEFTIRKTRSGIFLKPLEAEDPESKIILRKKAENPPLFIG